MSKQPSRGVEPGSAAEDQIVQGCVPHDAEDQQVGRALPRAFHQGLKHAAAGGGA